MPAFRINKTNNYTVMSNYHLRDMNLSLKAKGLLSVMLSLPPEWDYSVNGLCTIVKENRTAVKSALNELKKFGYLNVTKLYSNQTESKHIEYVYDIYEIPICKDENLDAQNIHLEKLYVENHQQINKDKLNKEKINKEYIGEDGTVETVPKHNSKITINNSNNNYSTQQVFRQLEELSIPELEQLRQIVLENRDTRVIPYRQIQKQFNLVEKVTWTTPENCNRIIMYKKWELENQYRNSNNYNRYEPRAQINNNITEADLSPEVF